MALSRNWIVVCGVVLCYSLLGCGGGKEDFKPAKQVQKDRSDIIKKKDEEHAHDKEHDHHHHHAPHHGSLTMLGDHAAQIELTLDADEGKLTVYVLDGEAEKPLTLDQADLDLVITTQGDGGLPLKLTPIDVAKQEEGFTVQNDKLKGLKELKGTITSLKIKGKEKTDEKVAVEFDAKKAEAEAEEAHKHGHDEHKSEGKADAHKDHDDKDHKHDEKAKK